ncbi:MAG: GIY-YIG catalytic domain protein [Firmicutes bacterium ADurb.Bin419]|nr:MAG: GIY-YIG catalytic domain protein [Firmicutes bacterium ADurb.Bin419]
MSKKYYIYLFKDSLDNVIYVGMTTTFERRVFQHKDKEWFVNVSKVFKSEPLENETVAKIYEIYYINKFKASENQKDNYSIECPCPFQKELTFDTFNCDFVTVIKNIVLKMVSPNENKISIKKPNIKLDLNYDNITKEFKSMKTKGD